MAESLQIASIIMRQNIRLRFKGKTYEWDGTYWTDSKTRSIPALTIVSHLNAELETKLRDEDATIGDPAILTQRASILRDKGQYKRSEKFIRHALDLSPNNPAALAVLCSVLRTQNRPQQALDETDPWKREPFPELLTSRASALCDLKRWDEAKRSVGRALGMQQSQEAFNVVKRIKKARPDLYK